MRLMAIAKGLVVARVYGVRDLIRDIDEERKNVDFFDSEVERC